MIAERPSLAEELDHTTLADRRRALGALLRRPLLTADGPRAGDFALVRRHADWLRAWLERRTGWRLQVTSELARLRKTPPTLDDPSRPACEPRQGRPFSRRRYVLLCLALAALERADRQTTLQTVAEEIVQLAAGDPALAAAGVRFDLETRDQRRDLVQVIRFLLDLRVIVRVHGDERHYLERRLGGRGDALYDIRRPVLAAMLTVRRSPATIEAEGFEERLRRLAEEALPDSPEGRNRALRWRFTRALLDDPLIDYRRLDDQQLAYLHSQRPALIRHVQEATGLHPEVRREGLAMVDERGDLSDLGLPDEGTDGHLTLLLAEHLAAHARAGDESVGRAALEQHTAALIAEHRRHWAKHAAEPGAEKRLLQRALERLEALSLVHLGDDGRVTPAPAIGRYALGDVHRPEAP